MSQVIAHSLEFNRTKDVTLDESVTFESLMLNENVLKGLKVSGFKKPSPIQFKSIPVGRCGFDVIVKSKSGTGKTLVYSIIALETIEIEKHEVQVLILAPTREIAVQIQEVITSIGSNIKGLKVEAFIGGLPLEEDKEKCKNCHIAVGAPGRVKHLISEGILKPNSIRLFVLDEVDKLTESSFISDINEIFNSLPDRKQIITTSATYHDELYTFLCKYMLSPTYIEINTETPLLLGLKQFVKIIAPYTSVVQEFKFKNEELLNLFSTISFTQCLIFTNYQTRAESISNFLNQKGWCSTYISAAQSQTKRLETVNNLKNFKCKILLSTDLTARGIDAAKVDLVINYDVPTSAVTYLHRMGRAGRFGSRGICIDFVSTGAPLQQWQNMIGLIGGNSLGIPKLPEFNGSVSDLLKLDVPSEQCIFGVIDSTYTPEINMTLKQNILDLKERKNVKSNCTEEHKIDLQELNQAESHVIQESRDILEVASGIINEISNNHDSGGSTLKQINHSSANENYVLDSSTNYRDCKRSKSDSSHNPTQLPEESVLHKNKALLCVTQILSHNKSIDQLQPDLYSLHHYLDALRKYDKNEIGEIMAHTKSKSIVELLKNINEVHDSHEVENEAENNDIENIFKIGYNYATKSNSKHWSSYLPSSELSNFKNLCLKEQDISHNDYTENTYEEGNSDDMDNEFSDVAVTTNHYDTDMDEHGCKPEIMKWVPVEKLDIGQNINRHTENVNVSDWEHLESHFNQCSENLWQSGLCFESIEDFDNWFYQEWQSQVLSVRDYIQQNIYVQEMSQYQGSKYINNKK